MKRYYCKMSDESVVNFESPSAAQALCSALETCLGRTVLQCWTGDSQRRMTHGFTDFEVPVHIALNEAPPKRTRSLPDNTMDMFVNDPRRKKGDAHHDT